MKESGTQMEDEKGYETHLVSFKEARRRLDGARDWMQSTVVGAVESVWEAEKARQRRLREDEANPISLQIARNWNENVSETGNSSKRKTSFRQRFGGMSL